uniref:Uncharacterized protein n=1 Tax=Tanacetum cinerariifolium TaxID=118510 RepID=A0A6L2LRD2_TANCI|nr:hypothetical protein [Tanacetum cinerariifolium]
MKGISEYKASESNIRRIRVKDIVKEVIYYLKTYSLAGMDISWRETQYHLKARQKTSDPINWLYKFACKLDTLSSLLVQRISGTFHIDVLFETFVLSALIYWGGKEVVKETYHALKFKTERKIKIESFGELYLARSFLRRVMIATFNEEEAYRIAVSVDGADSDGNDRCKECVICLSSEPGRFNLKRTSLTGFPAQSIRSSNAIAFDSPYLLVLITRTSQSRQHDKSESDSYYLSDLSRQFIYWTEIDIQLTQA